MVGKKVIHIWISVNPEHIHFRRMFFYSNVQFEVFGVCLKIKRLPNFCSKDKFKKANNIKANFKTSVYREIN